MIRLALIAVLALLCVSAHAAETDQYMTWDIELRDAAPAFNAYLNEEATRFLELRNKRSVPIKTVDTLAIDFYAYLFEGLHRSRMRGWLATSEEVDRFPPNDKNFWQYQRESIYRDLSFPFVLPMSRTVRLGDVYLGIDKMSHFFGFGRRYAAQYGREIKAGESHQDAIRAVVTRGVFHETKLVGGLVDGIISHADLEANYQGMRMCLQLASDTAPRFVKVGEDWALEGKIDVLPYITPGMDESWNNSQFTGLRRRNVLQRLQEQYCADDLPSIAQQRFELYRSFPLSESQEIIDDIFADEEGRTPQDKQALQHLCHTRETQACVRE